MRVSLLPLHYGPVVKNLTLIFCPKFFSWLLHMYIDFKKKFGPKCQCKIFHGGSVIEGHLWNDSNKKSWKWHVSLILALGGAPRADLHVKHPSTMGHESLIQRRPSLSHPVWLKYFFSDIQSVALNYHTPRPIETSFSWVFFLGFLFSPPSCILCKRCSYSQRRTTPVCTTSYQKPNQDLLQAWT